MIGRSGRIDRTLALSVRSCDTRHVSPFFEYCSPDLNGHQSTRHCGISDRTLSLQRLVVFSKVLEMNFFDRTCPVMLDRTLPASDHTMTSYCAARQHDRTQTLSVRFVHDPASGHSPTLVSSLPYMAGRAGPPEASVRSLHNQRHSLLFTSNFFTLAQMCQPPSVSLVHMC